MVFRTPAWYIAPGSRGWAFVLVSGLLIAIIIEYLAVRVSGVWSYSARMPLVPGLRVGLTPLLQTVLLPAASLQIAALRLRGKRQKAENA